MQQYFSITYIVTTTTTLPITTATTYTVKYAVCDDASEMCWALVGIGSVIVAILLIAMITCMVFTGTAVKGMNTLIEYLSNSTRANGDCDIQPQQQQPQNEGKYR